MKDVKITILELTTEQLIAESYRLEAFLMGHDLAHEPVWRDDQTLLYVGIVKDDELNYVKKDVAFPTDKQIGYVSWCCNLGAGVVEEFQLTKAECSQIITSHKADGLPSSEEGLKKFLKREPCAKPIVRDKKDAPTDPACANEEWEDDIPF